MNTFSYPSAHKYHEYEYHWSAEGILFNVEHRCEKTVIMVIFIVLFFPPYCANFSTHCGRKGLFTLISVIFAYLLGISMLIFCIFTDLLVLTFPKKYTHVSSYAFPCLPLSELNKKAAEFLECNSQRTE